jgi:hypothetical protein
MCDTAFTSPRRESRSPGLYLSDPQGHALLVDERRELMVVDLGGVVQIGGIDVRDPDVLNRLGERLCMLAGRLRERIANPYHPGAVGVLGGITEGAAE